MHRVLKPGGRLIVSVEHPLATFLMHHLAGREVDYFELRERAEEWTMGGQTTCLTFWDRPLHAMAEAFTAAGFHIEAMTEPAALPSARDVHPDTFDRYPDGRFLAFLFFLLRTG